jgi:membrane protein DedA with SNARE-associated domain
VLAPSRAGVRNRRQTVNFAPLIEQHGYTVTFVGALIEGESVMVLAGLAAHRGYLHLPLLAALAALGSFLGDQVYFLVGRRYGDRLVARFPRLEPGVRHADALLLRYAGTAVIAVRFLYGLRVVGPIAKGMTRLKWRAFVLFNAVGAALWSVWWLSVGYMLGELAGLLLGDVRRIEHWLFLGFATAALAVVAYLHWRRRPAARAASSNAR